MFVVAAVEKNVVLSDLLIPVSHAGQSSSQKENTVGQSLRTTFFVQLQQQTPSFDLLVCTGYSTVVQRG